MQRNARMGSSCKFYDTKFQVTSVYSLENTDILEQIMCFDRKDVSLKFDFLLDNVTKSKFKNIKKQHVDPSVSFKVSVF